MIFTYFRVKVIGVEPEFAASYTAALKAGKPVAAPITPTLADGLAVPTVGPHAFEVARHYVDECVTCTEKQISIAMLRLIENEKMIVEGGGAAGLAALLPGGRLDRPELKGKNIVVPLCGGNIDSTTLVKKSNTPFFPILFSVKASNFFICSLLLFHHLRDASLTEV